MARRTKADALVTRDNILDSAGLLFVKQGVSRTTLSQIAARQHFHRESVHQSWPKRTTVTPVRTWRSDGITSRQLVVA